MPRRNRRNRSKRNKKGGFLGYGEDSSASDGNSEGSGWFDSLKKSTGSATGSVTSWFSSDTPPPSPPPSPPPPPPSTDSSQPLTSGGKRRRRNSRRMRGGYSDNVSMTNLASRAAPFSGETARPQAYVGGRRTKRRCHTHKRSHRRHCRK